MGTSSSSIPEKRKHLLEALAFLTASFIMERRRPRLLLLGFDENELDQIQQILQQTDKELLFLRPEDTGKLNKAFEARGQDEVSCVIALGHENLGRYASLVTSFQILEKTVSQVQRYPKISGDISTLHDLFLWIVSSDRKLKDLVDFLRKRVSLGTEVPLKRAYSLLRLLHRYTSARPSFLEWVHPIRTISAIIGSLEVSASGREATVGDYLMHIGIEPSGKTRQIPLFVPQELGDEDAKTLERNFSTFTRMIGEYHTSSIKKTRTNLAKLTLNVLRIILYELAMSETGSRGRWSEVLARLEETIPRAVRRKRRFNIESRGTYITERSTVSGLPASWSSYVRGASTNDGDADLLQELHEGLLSTLMNAYHAEVPEQARSFYDSEIELHTKSFLLNEFERDDHLVRDSYLSIEITFGEGTSVLDTYTRAKKDFDRRITNLLTARSRDVT